MTWLAWANYTWFASGYDNKSTAFRALSMVIMFGSLTLAGGIQSAFGDQPIWLALVGFTIMRFGMIALWLGVANGDRHVRPTALCYAAGIGTMQLYWTILIIALPPQAALYLPFFATHSTSLSLANALLPLRRLSRIQ
jgi:low temperature requirement protein LtrA